MQANESEGRLNRQENPQVQPNAAAEQPAAPQSFRQHVREYLGMMPTTANLNYIQQHRILFLSGKTEVIDPDKQSYAFMLHQSYCPHWQLFSLTTLILLACIIYYILAVSMGFKNNTFLEVDRDTYTKLGANNARGVYKGEVYRLFVCVFLHVNLIHLISNMLALVLMLSAIEYTFGKVKTAVAFLVPAIVGNMFSNLLNIDQKQEFIKAGATGALFGTIGVGVAYMIVNWPSLSVVGPIFKGRILMQMLITALFLILFCDVARNVDFAGYLGCFLCGLFVGGLLPSIDLQLWQKITRITLGILFITSLLSCFLVFYLAPQDGYSK